MGTGLNARRKRDRRSRILKARHDKEVMSEKLKKHKQKLIDNGNGEMQVKCHMTAMNDCIKKGKSFSESHEQAQLFCPMHNSSDNPIKY